MLPLTQLIVVGGVLHLGILLASMNVPGVLDWRRELAGLSPLTRNLVWVHGVFIVVVIVGFGVISLFNAVALASGTSLARWVCGFIAFFWLARLAVQFFVFDAKPYLTRLWLKLGYHGLTVVFIYLALVYAAAALLPHAS